MIKDLKFKIPVNPKGSITSGIKKISEKTGNEYPASIDYFNILDFPELIKSYGDKPKKLVIFFPTNNPEDFLDINYVLYGKNNQLIRKCDGETCFHRITNIIGDAEFRAGTTTPCVCKMYELTDEHDKKCRPFFWFKAFVGDIKLGKVDSPTCYLFKTGSKNSAENIISEITKVLNLTGGNLIGIPFGLSVDMVSGSQDAKTKFPIWNIQVLGSISQIKQWNQEVQMRIPSRDELKMLNEPPKDDTPTNETLFEEE